MPAAAPGDPRRGARHGPAAPSQADDRNHVGLCWLLVSTAAGERIVWDNGGSWGFRSFAGFAPEQNRAAVVLSNTDRVGFALTRDADGAGQGPGAPEDP